MHYSLSIILPGGGNVDLCKLNDFFVTTNTNQDISGNKSISGEVFLKNNNIHTRCPVSIGSSLGVGNLLHHHRIDLGYHDYDRLNVFEGEVNFYPNLRDEIPEDTKVIKFNNKTSQITANSFKVNNGTSSHFLKGDGSVDDNKYLKLDENGRINLPPTIQCNKMADNATGYAIGWNFYSYDDIKTASFGILFSANNVFNSLYCGWGENPWMKNSCLAISENFLLYKNQQVWHEGNDGEGSGLDADLLDGKQGSEYALTNGYVKQIITKQLTNEDLNDIIDTKFSFYWGNPANTCKNKPSGILAFSLQSFPISSNTYCHILVEPNGKIYKRIFDSSSWSSWKRLLDEDDYQNILDKLEKVG